MQTLLHYPLKFDFAICIQAYYHMEIDSRFVMNKLTDFWRYLAQALAVCVLLFSVSAKLSQYQHTALTPNTTSKLWLNGQKMELQSAAPDKAMLVIAWAMTLFGFAFVACRIFFFSSSLRAPLRRRISSHQVRLHLRPPPRF
jgi:hypothetical protein